VIGATLVPVGPSGWLVELEDEDAVLPLSRHLFGLRDGGRLDGVLDIVPGARTVLLDCDVVGPQRGALAEVLQAWDRGDEPQESAPAPVEIPVVYDGIDLDDVARLSGLSTAEVVDLHTGSDLLVAFCGFSAGFAYITGTPAALHVPRLSVPRTAVPPGSVAIAEEFTSVYPRRSPGGWRLIGTTGVRLWNQDQTPPALLSPGTRVRFAAR
jgi:KipI family sensor histidine kinase inhibitor